MPSDKITNRISFPIGVPFPTNIPIFLLECEQTGVHINFSMYQKKECQHKDTSFVG